MKKIYTILIFVIICSVAGASTLPETKGPAKIICKVAGNGTVNVRSLSAEAVTFYLFDLDGRLIHEAAIKEQTAVTIGGLKKGCYLYSILQKDETISEGKLTVK